MSNYSKNKQGNRPAREAERVSNPTGPGNEDPLQVKSTRNHSWDRYWTEYEPEGIDRLSRLIFEKMREAVDFGGKKILELGCGTGRLSLLALRAGAETATLVDSSPQALTIAKRLFRDLENVEFIEKNIKKIRLRPDYDIVFSSGVLEHFPPLERPEIVDLHRRCSRRTVMIMVPAAPHYNNLRMRLPETVRLYGWQRPLTRPEMKNLFLQSGIEVRVNRRFDPLYAVPRLERIRPLRKFLRPLEEVLGGLLLTAGEIDEDR